MRIFDFLKTTIENLLKNKTIENQCDNYINYWSNPEYVKAEIMYHKNIERIEVMYSILNNSKTYFGDSADKFLELCIDGTLLISNYKKVCLKFNVSVPEFSTAHYRLAMFYEKRKEYTKGITICVDAIKNGYHNDGTKGQMYGRLARLMRKANIDINIDDYLK